MQILVENGTYAMCNHGDIAMLQAGVARLRALWPEARFSIITDYPDRVNQLLPDVRPILSCGHLAWFHDGSVFGKLWKVAPDLERALRLKHVARIRPVVIARKRRHGIDAGPIRDYIDALAAADLVVCTGGGFLTDVFTFPASVFLDTLRMAHEMKKPTALLGQGVGPIATPKLREILARALPCLDLITLREKREGLGILRSLGYPEEKVVVTGDDATEMAYRERPARMGEALGINLRVSYYSGVDPTGVPPIREAIQQIARERRASILPIPIAQYHNADGLSADSDSIRRLLAGLDDASDGGASLQAPVDVIRQVGRCRLVITGSYHAGVFALSQGIPVIGLAQSDYYVAKFGGLADQFGCGCETVLLSQADLKQDLLGKAARLWNDAETLRPRLLQSAEDQIARGRKAYERLRDLAMCRDRGKAIGPGNNHGRK